MLEQIGTDRLTRRRIPDPAALLCALTARERAVRRRSLKGGLRTQGDLVSRRGDELTARSGAPISLDQAILGIGGARGTAAVTGLVTVVTVLTARERAVRRRSLTRGLRTQGDLVWRRERAVSAPHGAPISLDQAILGIGGARGTAAVTGLVTVVTVLTARERAVRRRSLTRGLRTQGDLVWRRERAVSAPHGAPISLDQAILGIGGARGTAAVTGLVTVVTVLTARERAVRRRSLTRGLRTQGDLVWRRERAVSAPHGAPISLDQAILGIGGARGTAAVTGLVTVVTVLTARRKYIVYPDDQYGLSILYTLMNSIGISILYTHYTYPKYNVYTIYLSCAPAPAPARA